MNHLIIVPDGNPIFPAWCLEHAMKSELQGNRVFLLNMQNFNIFNHNKRVRSVFSSLMRKNSSSKLIAELSEKNRIVVLNDRELIHDLTFSQLSQNAKNVFDLAIKSKYGAVYGDRNVDIDSLPEELIKIERFFFAQAFKRTQNEIVSRDIETVTTVNGRLVVSSAIVCASRELGRKVFLIESVDLLGNRYCVFEKSPHDLHEVALLQSQLWSSANGDKELEADRYFRDHYLHRLKELNSVDYVFEDKYFRPNHYNKLASFFPTTDTEFPVFSDFHVASTYGGSQREAFKVFARVAKENGFKVVVRAHPQNKDSAHLGEKEDAIWKSICNEYGADFIDSLSKVNSYDLINKSDLCATYCSSIGIEIILSKKPFIMLGESDYSNYVLESLAYSEQDLAKLFRKGVPTIDVNNLYPWAYWYSKGGESLKFFSVIKSGQLMYEGKKLDQERLIFSKLKKIIRKD